MAERNPYDRMQFIFTLRTPLSFGRYLPEKDTVSLLILTNTILNNSYLSIYL